MEKVKESTMKQMGVAHKKNGVALFVVQQKYHNEDNNMIELEKYNLKVPEGWKLIEESDEPPFDDGTYRCYCDHEQKIICVPLKSHSKMPRYSLAAHEIKHANDGRVYTAVEREIRAYSESLEVIYKYGTREELKDSMKYLETHDFGSYRYDAAIKTIRKSKLWKKCSERISGGAG